MVKYHVLILLTELLLVALSGFVVILEQDNSRPLTMIIVFIWLIRNKSCVSGISFHFHNHMNTTQQIFFSDVNKVIVGFAIMLLRPLMYSWVEKILKASSFLDVLIICTLYPSFELLQVLLNHPHVVDTDLTERNQLVDLIA